GMASKHKSITLNTGFRIGSLSKPFTALAIMQLDEMKKLKVNDSVVKYIRELNGSWQQVTIEDLLTHRVSLSQDLFEDNNLRLANKATNKELISFVNQKSNVPKLMAKGKAQYCNSCYVLLAEIVARVSKMSFAEYMKRNFFTPFNMESSYIFEKPDSFRKGTALNYARNRQFLGIEQYTTGAMGQVSSISDLKKFVHYLKNGAVVSHKTLTTMTKPHVELEGGFYGLGWMVGEEGRPFYAHGGDQDGYQSELYINPELGIELIMLSNGGASTAQIHGEIIRKVLKYFRVRAKSEE
ncbi:MAG: beta-lactamase family protein, partial [Kangiellaceae bacterium]|nr:beta-lactamase family protein [Kangiellaceae bacterium]